MGNYTNAHALAEAQRKRAESVQLYAKLEHHKLASELHQEAWRLLSGNTSQRTLDALGNPFGRRATTDGSRGRQRRIKGAKGLMPVLPINAQTGKLRDALKLIPRKEGTKQMYLLTVLKSLAPYARYILNPDGTNKMVTRPFWFTLQKLWKRKNLDLLIKIRQKAKKT